MTNKEINKEKIITSHATSIFNAILISTIWGVQWNKYLSKSCTVAEYLVLGIVLWGGGLQVFKWKKLQMICNIKLQNTKIHQQVKQRIWIFICLSPFLDTSNACSLQLLPIPNCSSANNVKDRLFFQVIIFSWPTRSRTTKFNSNFHNYVLPHIFLWSPWMTRKQGTKEVSRIGMD